MVIYRGTPSAPGKDLVPSTWASIIDALGIDPRYKPILRGNSQETKFLADPSLLFDPGNMAIFVLNTK